MVHEITNMMKCVIIRCYILNFYEKNMMFGFNMGGNHELLLNTLIFISKWSIWKARNKVTKFISIKMYFVIYGNRL